jgi:hypothetical protein
MKNEHTGVFQNSWADGSHHYTVRNNNSNQSQAHQCRADIDATFNTVGKSLFSLGLRIVVRNSTGAACASWLEYQRRSNALPSSGENSGLLAVSVVQGSRTIHYVYQLVSSLCPLKPGSGY